MVQSEVTRVCPPRGIAIDVRNCLVALFYGSGRPSEYFLKLEEASCSFFYDCCGERRRD